MVVADEDIAPFGDCPIGASSNPLSALPSSMWPFSHDHFIEIKPSDSITTFVDAVIDSSRYYVVRIKVKSDETMLPV